MIIANEILMFLRSSKKHANEYYLQEPIGTDREGNQVTLEDKLADSNDDIDEQIHLKMQITLLNKIVQQTLKERERKIIELRYGLLDGEEVTQREIAKMLDISRSYVYRLG